MFNYAQLDENNICYGLSQFGVKIEDPSVVLVDTHDGDLFFRKFENGVWSEEKFLPE